MRGRLPVLVVLATLGVLAAPAAWGDSLWTAESRSIYDDSRQFKVGDLLTIVVMEKSSASQAVNTNGDEKSAFNVNAGSGFLQVLIPNMDKEFKSEYQGSGKTSRSGVLTGQLTVTVTGIDANGVLLVEGRQKIKVNGDLQEFYVRRKVRPEDVSIFNTVVSSCLADAYIEYKGEGGSGDSAKPGIITRIFSWLF